MTATLPYLPSPGSIKNALEKIRAAATPERFTKDFVSTILHIKGGTGSVIPPFLKRIGFVGTDGVPTDLYRKFRNPAKGGAAVADAIKIGYRELLQANEYFYKLSEKELKALIVQVTGLGANDRVITLVYSSLMALMGFADFDHIPEFLEEVSQVNHEFDAQRKIELPNGAVSPKGRVGLNLSYTINLNLPATSDQAVFNAIFRSLKEHLLSTDE
jgi:hypothetical protein